MMDDLRRAVRAFANERDWEQYHSPKNLAAGLAVEAAELLEVFLWKSEPESYELTDGELDRLRHEIGDVQIHLANLADKFDLDPIECARAKLAINEQKYPVDLVRGSAKKYTEYEPRG